MLDITTRNKTEVTGNVGGKRGNWIRFCTFVLLFQGEFCEYYISLHCLLKWDEVLVYRPITFSLL